MRSSMLGMRLLSYGCRVAAWFPAEGQPLTDLSQLDAQAYIHLPAPELSLVFAEQAAAEEFIFVDVEKPTDS